MINERSNYYLIFLLKSLKLFHLEFMCVTVKLRYCLSNLKNKISLWLCWLDCDILHKSNNFIGLNACKSMNVCQAVGHYKMCTKNWINSGGFLNCDLNIHETSTLSIQISLLWKDWKHTEHKISLVQTIPIKYYRNVAICYTAQLICSIHWKRSKHLFL